ncbi:hypothetical protein BJY52DRAFT_1221081 [Lactarius psammicola]|nr:hypothetical protein BJY52DRAFT_1221081 [Lactarius psammicola]
MRQPADLPLHLLLAGLRVTGYRLNCGPNANRVYVPLENEIPTATCEIIGLFADDFDRTVDHLPVAKIQGQIAGTTDRQNLVIIGQETNTIFWPHKIGRPSGITSKISRTLAQSYWSLFLLLSHVVPEGSEIEEAVEDKMEHWSLASDL